MDFKFYFTQIDYNCSTISAKQSGSKRDEQFIKQAEHKLKYDVFDLQQSPPAPLSSTAAVFYCCTELVKLMVNCNEQAQKQMLTVYVTIESN